MQRAESPVFTREDMQYMHRAIALAKKGEGYVNPNPLVGAVIVDKGKIIGEGYHTRYGRPHAEREAFLDCERRGEVPCGATLYVTLEPCCHHGMNPPCTEAIMQKGIQRVVVGSLDPNPLVAGKGIAILRKAGIQVDIGCLGRECDAINSIFFHYITTHTPYVIAKVAMTADGKIATCTGKSQWITSEEASRHVHVTRHRISAIMVGIGTVLADDPMLTCRLEDKEMYDSPYRIICDAELSIPFDSKIVKTAQEIPTYIATRDSLSEKAKALEEVGVHCVEVPVESGRVDLSFLMRYLGEQLKIDSVLLEGGSMLHYSAFEAGIVNELQLYVAPKIFGGIEAKTAVTGIGVREPEEAYRLANPRVQAIGEDILIVYDVVKGE